ncbi:MAG: dethiobiotin synthase [Lachnospiraceae bacterium]
MEKGIFIIGTGTDVGKTYVSGLLAKKLNECGIKAGYFKAAVSGNEVVDGKIVPGDALYVKTTAGLSQDTENMVAHVYEHAYSPHLAAKLEGNPVCYETVMECFRKCSKEYEFVLAEGSGGILCPLRYDEQEIWLEDIISATGLDSVIVADAGLGTINSVLLTVFYMKERGLPVRGIMMNHYEDGNILHQDNRRMIREKTNLPVLACIGDGEQEIRMDIQSVL